MSSSLVRFLLARFRPAPPPKGSTSARAALRFACRAVLVAGAFAAAIGRGAGSAEGGWSSELLTQILRATPETSQAAGSAQGEMVLQTYRLSHLRIGEAGKTNNLLAILEKLLPSGSTVNRDVPANSLHVLTTPAAQKAVWDYLSAVDAADAAPQPAPGAVPDDVKLALRKLAEAGDQSAKLAAAIGELKSDMSRSMANIELRQRQHTMRLLAGGAVLIALLGATLAWMLRRRAAAVEPADSVALTLVPERLTTALAPVHDKMRSDMLGLLNEVAIKLQAQHNEQQQLVREQQKQLEDARLALAEERRQFISETGSMVVQAVERVDATTAKLAKQQDKVAELVQELQHTVRELDETKDNLRDREVELEQERAKIAALSLLLEEGGGNGSSARGSAAGGGPDLLRPSNGHTRGAGTESANGRTVAVAGSDLTPCTIRLPGPAAATPPRFQFLPPDHPES